jgi:hypothetical protein
MGTEVENRRTSRQCTKRTSVATRCVRARRRRCAYAGTLTLAGGLRMRVGAVVLLRVCCVLCASPPHLLMRLLRAVLVLVARVCLAPRSSVRRS